jgi:hypothetical protein
MNIVVTGPYSLFVIKCRNLGNWSTEDFWILATPGSTCRACNWVGHLIASLHLVAVGYLCLGIGYPGEELARVVWVPNSARCFTLCFIFKVFSLDENVRLQAGVTRHWSLASKLGKCERKCEENYEGKAKHLGLFVTDMFGKHVLFI